MGKRGPKPKSKVKIEWSPNFAYAIGLLATDGCLSRDRRHIDLTSVDSEQLENFMKCLKFKAKISLKKSGSGSISGHVQFSDVFFHDFLQGIGMTPAKSLTMGKLAVPDGYFFDFLRGCFDGDGCSYSYWDTRWRSSFMFYISFASSSPIFIHWIRQQVSSLSGIRGHITRVYKKHIQYQLKYSKHEAIKLVEKMYTGDCVYLSRKKLKIEASFGMMTISGKEKMHLSLTK
jgi:hypothetical protein